MVTRVRCVRCAANAHAVPTWVLPRRVVYLGGDVPRCLSAAEFQGRNDGRWLPPPVVGYRRVRFLRLERRRRPSVTNRILACRSLPEVIAVRWADVYRLGASACLNSGRNLTVDRRIACVLCGIARLGTRPIRRSGRRHRDRTHQRCAKNDESPHTPLPSVGRIAESGVAIPRQCTTIVFGEQEACRTRW
jgi:hypothetical protein